MDAPQVARRNWAHAIALAALLTTGMPECTRAEGIADRRSMILSLAKERTPALSSTKTGAYEILAATAAQGCRDPYWPAYMAKTLALNPAENEERLPYDLFAMPPLVRYLSEYGSCIGDTQVQEIKKSLSRELDITGHGTLNHAIMKLSSFYLFAQMYDDIEWTDADGTRYSSRSLMNKLKSFLLSRTKGMFEDGFNESVSPIYFAVNIVPILNLIDFAKDPEVRDAAEKEAILLLSILKANYFDGRIIPPISRSTVHQIPVENSAKSDYPAVSAQLTSWFYFGTPHLTASNIVDRRVPSYLTIAALSQWSPPEAVLQLADNISKPYHIYSEIPRFSYWGAKAKPQLIGNSMVSQSYAIGAGNMIFDPSGYNEANQTFGIMFNSGKPAALVDCYHPYWLSNEGENAWRYDRSSPFQQIFRDGSRGIVIFDIPKIDPYRYTLFNRFYKTRNNNADALFQSQNCRFPSNADSVYVEGNVITMQVGSAYAGIRSVNAPFVKSPHINRWEMKYFNTVTANSAVNGIYFRVAESSAYKSFQDFTDSFLKDAVSMHGTTATFASESGGTIDVSFKTSLDSDGWIRSIPLVKRNGAIVPQEPSGIPFETPFLRLEHGELSFFKDGRKSFSVRP